MQQGPGLTATELADVLAELGPALTGAVVRDVARLRERDDLLLFLDLPGGSRRALHVVPGGRRARVTCTERRFSKAGFATGPLVDRLAEALRGARVAGLDQPPGERRCTLRLQAAGGAAAALEIELFGARGLWCLLDAGGCIRELSRLPNAAGRALRPGEAYAPPPPREGDAADPAPRFQPPCAQAVDEYFTAGDLAEEAGAQRRELTQAVSRATRKLTHKVEGLARQLQEVDRVGALRQEADMLLAYGFALPPGAPELRCPDPADPERTLTYPLRPGQPIHVQAERLYQRARKLEDGAAVAAERHAAAREELAELGALAAGLDAAGDDEAALDALRARLVGLGVVRADPGRPAAPRGPSPRERQLQKITKGHNFRVFESVEGFMILVGRSNQQNDRLSVSVARGNDLWFHVGRGHAGSHVVMRLPKGSSASLESLLDAATLAIHFSKARNAGRCEVIYTWAKNVRKPKGLPPGRVTTTNTKTLVVDVDRARLQRLLDGAPAAGD